MRVTSKSLAVLALALACAALVRAQSASKAPASGKQAAANATTTATPGVHQTATAVDFEGDWVLDPSRSDAPWMRGGGSGRGMGGPGGSRMGGGFRRGRGQGEAGPGWRGRDSQGAEGSGRSDRPARLPARFHITQTPTLVSFEDSTGAVIQEIATVSAAADTFMSAPGASHRLGAWKGRSLESTREGRGGSKFVETWSLEDGGASLIAVVHIEGGDSPNRTMRRVYHRVHQP